MIEEYLLHAIVLLGIAIAAPIEAIFDEIVSRSRKIEHWLSATIRVTVIGSINAFYFEEWWYIGLHTVLGLGLYWFLFSGVWGYRRLNDFWYIGYTSFLDKMNRATTGAGAGGVIMFRAIVISIFCGIFSIFSIF
jgi:hypothetical protein